MHWNFVRLSSDVPIQVPMPASRARFNTENFAKLYDLGEPVAAAYFEVAAPGFE
jgi:hypothetical protein